MEGTEIIQMLHVDELPVSTVAKWANVPTEFIVDMYDQYLIDGSTLEKL